MLQVRFVANRWGHFHTLHPEIPRSSFSQCPQRGGSGVSGMNFPWDVLRKRSWKRPAGQAGASLQQILFLCFFPMIKPASSANKTWKNSPRALLVPQRSSRAFPAQIFPTFSTPIRTILSVPELPTSRDAGFLCALRKSNY